jgi:hypothetical protein
VCLIGKPALASSMYMCAAWKVGEAMRKQNRLLASALGLAQQLQAACTLYLLACGDLLLCACCCAGHQACSAQRV